MAKINETTLANALFKCIKDGNKLYQWNKADNLETYYFTNTYVLVRIHFMNDSVSVAKVLSQLNYKMDDSRYTVIDRVPPIASMKTILDGSSLTEYRDGYNYTPYDPVYIMNVMNVFKALKIDDVTWCNRSYYDVNKTPSNYKPAPARMSGLTNDVSCEACIAPKRV